MASDRERSQGYAVVRLPPGDEARPSILSRAQLEEVLPGELDSRLHGLGTWRQLVNDIGHDAKHATLT